MHKFLHSRTDVGKVTRKLQRIDYRTADLRVALDAEVEHPAKRVRPEQTQRLLVRRVRLEPEVRNPRDLGVLLEPSIQ